MSIATDFFSEKHSSAASSLSEKQMLELMKDLADTHHWVAILKYLNARKKLTQDALYTIDPIKDPTLMARTQGILTGLSDLEEAVYRLTNKKQNDQE